VHYPGPGPQELPQGAEVGLTRPETGINISLRNFNYPGRSFVANHLTPTELADELQMKRQEVIGKCVQMGVPILHGRIDRTLFESSLRNLAAPQEERRASAA
jgi:hypothetical protein